MKKIKNNLLLIAVIFLLSLASNSVFAAGAEHQAFVSEKDTTSQEKVVCYEVFGMDCPGCQSALEKQVKKIDGVANAKASFKEKQVIIELKPGAEVTEKEIEERIKKANFTPGKKIELSKNEE
ncbi:heavy-metal-associated domain-containing protein [Draconibacterium halophilum]|uniref:Heavy-metal-associated domain-containing protein n=1 Tax=Draconibacterium halophilum TaxID=2706887 RepID=A0A6C0RH11_9BACT|nr:heavy metal-associated domain-containing protein [Draconibacterium halophilum]QIA08371.1 heavy-metal-associated domain-containing protein [Draconibacterium halophilum]